MDYKNTNYRVWFRNLYFLSFAAMFYLIFELGSRWGYTGGIAAMVIWIFGYWRAGSWIEGLRGKQIEWLKENGVKVEGKDIDVKLVTFSLRSDYLTLDEYRTNWFIKARGMDPVTNKWKDYVSDDLRINMFVSGKMIQQKIEEEAQKKPIYIYVNKDNSKIYWVDAEFIGDMVISPDKKLKALLVMLTFVGALGMALAVLVWASNQ